MFKKKTIDPLGNQTIEISDAFHRIDTVEKRSSKNELLAKTVFRYDRKGNKTKETEFVYADGMLLREYVVEWTYSPTDLVETCTEEPGTPEEKKTSNSYIRGGLLETITKPDGVCVTHGYDGFLRLSSISSSDGTISYTYSYDLNDNVLSVKDEKLQLTHTKTYDTHSRVTKDSIGTGVETSFFYDALDRVTGFSTGNAKINYLYQSGRLHNVVRKDGSDTQLYTHTYDSFDLRGNVTKSSPIASCGSIQFNWDLLGRLDHTTSDQFEETLTKFDDAGNLLEQTLRDPQGMITSTFSYDDLYQLIDEKGVLDAAYKNDSLNNRLQKNDDPYTINALNQLVSDNDTSYEYDKNGNPIQIGSMRLSYDALDRLILLERPGFSRTEYAYDESHRRISKSTSLWQEGSWHEDETLRFIFFNKREVGCLAPDDTMKEFRVLGLGKGAELGASVAIEVDGGIFCPLHDHRGNISLLIDTATNQPTDTYRYSVFGEETSFGSTQNPWHFASKRTDPESGFVFFGRRYYSPTVGRFITPDPLGFADGPNLYSYVHNSPLILVDPYGLFGMEPGATACDVAAGATGPSGSDSSYSSPSIGTTGSGPEGLSPTFSQSPADDKSPEYDKRDDIAHRCGFDSRTDMDRYLAERFYSNPGATQLLIDLAFVWMPLEKLSPVFKEGWTVIKESSAFTKSANYVSKILSESRAASITAKTEQVAVKALSQSERFSNTAKSTSAMGFTGRKGFELTNPGKGNTIPSTGNRNPSMAYEGRTFSGHAVDQMQNRGIPFSAANNAMLHGETYPSQQVAGRTVFYDAQNDLSVIVQDSTEKVVTVTYGKSK